MSLMAIFILQMNATPAVIADNMVMVRLPVLTVIFYNLNKWPRRRLAGWYEY